MMRCILLTAILALAGCKPDETRLTAIIGAVLIDGHGGAPVSDSIVIISGSRIRAAGLRANIPVPAGSDKIDGRGHFAVPALIDLSSQKLDTPRVSTLAEAEQAVQSGSKVIRGMVTDTMSLDAGWLARVRALDVIFAPGLADLENSGDGFNRAMTNTGRLAGAGVGMAIASKPEREIELLLKAGVTTMDVVTAATRNGASALQKLDRMGTIESGKQADLMLLTANPLENPSALVKPARVMRAGEWAQ
jgi:imidazolonepropionase-like amidohydrolase